MIVNFKHILVATDLSEAAKHVYSQAAALALRFDARVTVLHVDPVAPMGFHSSDDLIRYMEGVQRRSIDALEKVQGWFERRGVASCQVVRATGEPAAQILEQVRVLEADVVLLARRSKTTFERWFMGSTVRRVIRHASKPVLLVDPALESVDASGWTQILTPTDFSEDSRLGLRAAWSLAQRLGASLSALHVVLLPTVVPTFPGEAGAPIPGDFWERLRRSYEGELGESVVEVSKDIEHRVAVAADVVPAIVDTLGEVGGQLLVVPSHGKGGFEANVFGSTSERLLEVAPVPVMVLPRTWLQAQ